MESWLNSTAGGPALQATSTGAYTGWVVHQALNGSFGVERKPSLDGKARSQNRASNASSSFTAMPIASPSSARVLSGSGGSKVTAPGSGGVDWRTLSGSATTARRA